MIKLLDTIVADVTMGSSWRPKDVACFTVFKLEELVLLHVYGVIKHTRMLVGVLIAP